MMIWEYFYYHIYVGTQTLHKMHLRIVFVLQLILFSFCFVLGIYNSFLLNFVFYIINAFPLLIYNDLLKNKIYYYFIAFVSFTVVELIGSFLFMIISAIFHFGVMFPQELTQMESTLFFIPMIIMLPLDFLVAYFMPKIIRRTHSLKMEKNILLILISIFILTMSLSTIYTATKENFLIVSIIFFGLFLVNLFFLNTNIHDFMDKYKNNLHNEYYQHIINEQKENLKSIDENYQRMRKRNHDFSNHIVIIDQLLKNDDVKVLEYITNVLDKYERG